MTRFTGPGVNVNVNTGVVTGGVVSTGHIVSSHDQQLQQLQPFNDTGPAQQQTIIRTTTGQIVR